MSVWIKFFDEDIGFFYYKLYKFILKKNIKIIKYLGISINCW